MRIKNRTKSIPTAKYIEAILISLYPNDKEKSIQEVDHNIHSAYPIRP